MSTVHDVVVVGGGIVGLATARALLLARPGSAVVLLDKEASVAGHQTGHNSGVLHAGLYYEPGSKRAELTARGRPMMEAFCDQHAVPRERNGKLVAMVARDERARFEALWQRVVANGVPDARRLGAQEARAVEPAVAALEAIHSPHTGVTDFAAVARVLAGEVARLGGEVRTGLEVCGLAESAGEVVLDVATPVGRGRARGHGAPWRDVVRARRVVACAGLQSDRLAAAHRHGTSDRADDAAGGRIVPFRGSWLEVTGASAELVRGNVYPVPDPTLPFLGVHATRGIDGRVLAGPNAVLAGARERYDRRFAAVWPDVRDAVTHPGLWRLGRRHWRAGFGELRRDLVLARAVADLRRYLPDVDPADVRRGPFGIRAQLVTADGHLHDDFAIDTTPRVLHVRNAPSPAATAALAIADDLAERVP